MLAAPAITFDSAALLAAGLALAGAAIVMALLRRAAAPALAAILLPLGLIALATAAGGPRVSREAQQRVAVLLDLSASTDGATFRDPAALERRIGELLGDHPRVTLHLGDSDDRTIWTPPPPDVSAVLLFSDGRFQPPTTAPPVFAVIDPALEQPDDAAVTSLERRGDQLIITTANGGPPRELRVSGVTLTTKPVAPSGMRTMSFPVEPGADVNVAQLAQGDRWPQNDALSIINPPLTNSERWWIGDKPPERSWSTPAGVPTSMEAYLAPSVIVLENVAATALSATQAQRLQQYVRDLGGGLLILGGDQAFAAGGYDGSPLGALSPLASSPPTPAAHWTFLLDASGSMSGQARGTTRLGSAVAAARETIAQLPPNDVLHIGRFADELRWWVRGQPVKDFTSLDVPTPRGPTNLDAALRALVGTLDKGVVNHVVLLSDGQVQLPAAEEIARSLKEANARVHVLAVGSGPGSDALRKLAADTGGTFAEEGDVARWAAGLAELLRQVVPRHWMTTPVQVRFGDSPTITTQAWNRTWLKSGANELARATVDGDDVPMAAQWNVGAGRVAAVAFRPPDGHVEALAARVQSPPRDPRLRVTWRTGRRLIVELDAADAAAPINGLAPTLVLTTPAGTSESFPVPQAGPGRYVLSLSAPRSPVYATLHEAGRVVDRFAVAGRYPAEFDGIGNDREALRSLAQRTGGRVIEPGERGPLTLPATRQRGTPVAHIVAAAGALLVGLGLVAWRVRR